MPAQVLSFSALCNTHIGTPDEGKVTAKAYVKAVAGGFRPTHPVGLDPRLWQLIQVWGLTINSATVICPAPLHGSIHLLITAASEHTLCAHACACGCAWGCLQALPGRNLSYIM